MKYVLTLLSLIIFSCSNTTSEAKSDAKTEPEVQKIVDNFFSKYKDSSPSDAIDYIFGTNKSFMPEQIAELKNKLTTTTLAVGAFNGTEQITIKRTSPSLVFYSYLVKHDKQPLRFTFIFYKPKEQWILYKFKFDDQVDTELEESGRIYFIK